MPTVRPLMSIPRMFAACAFASAASLASLTPPAFPLPPEWTWAFTITLPPYLAAMASASSAEVATSPGGTTIPAARKRSLAWYS